MKIYKGSCKGRPIRLFDRLPTLKPKGNVYHPKNRWGRGIPVGIVNEILI